MIQLFKVVSFQQRCFM